MWHPDHQSWHAQIHPSDNSLAPPSSLKCSDLMMEHKPCSRRDDLKDGATVFWECPFAPIKRTQNSEHVWCQPRFIWVDDCWSSTHARLLCHNLHSPARLPQLLEHVQRIVPSCFCIYYKSELWGRFNGVCSSCWLCLSDEYSQTSFLPCTEVMSQCCPAPMHWSSANEVYGTCNGCAQIQLKPSVKQTLPTLSSLLSGSSKCGFLCAQCPAHQHSAALLFFVPMIHTFTSVPSYTEVCMAIAVAHPQIGSEVDDTSISSNESLDLLPSYFLIQLRQYSPSKIVPWRDLISGL